jgi:hypothetical protein
VESTPGKRIAGVIVEQNYTNPKNHVKNHIKNHIKNNKNSHGTGTPTQTKRKITKNTNK